MTRNHRVQEKSMPQNAEIIKAMNEMKICQFHKEMDITYQCNDHGICVCTVCRVDTHRNCKNVFEIAKSEFADQILKDTLQSFTEVEKAAEATRKRREDNITRLYHSQDEILREKDNIIEQAIQKLEEMKFRYSKETNQKVQAAVSKIEHEIEDVSLIKEKSSRNREILEASLKYNNGSCAHVLAYLLKDEVKTLESSVQKIQQNGLFELTFEGNSESDCITVACLKAVKVQQLDTKDTEHRKAAKAGIEKN